jgi:hypothetical protein
MAVYTTSPRENSKFIEKESELIVGLAVMMVLSLLS